MARDYPAPGELLRRHGHSARKSWGQNFLHAPQVIQAIVTASGASPDQCVIEIGAGLGTLSAPLLATGAEVCAIERDRDLCAILRTELGDHPRLRLHEADAVRFDYGGVACDRGPANIVGNLPYHLTGPLLFALLSHHQRTGAWILMVQREVGLRLTAPPGSRTYGGVTAALSRERAVTRVCKVPRGCFVPPPKVDSVVVRLDPHPSPRGLVADRRGYLHLVRTAFQRRRKTIANALASLADRDTVVHWCAHARIDPTLRPEQLGPEQFAALQRQREQSADA